jgi:hypothetical protein
MGAAVFDRFDFILKIRLARRSAILGLVLLGTLLVSLGLYFIFGNALVPRVLYFPSRAGRHGLVAEQRFVPRHGIVVKDVTELADGVLLGPSRYDAVRLFPRGVSVTAAMLDGGTLYIDLSPQALSADPEVPVTGMDALQALGRTLRFNFPRIRGVVFFIDGQLPRFPDKKKI